MGDQGQADRAAWEGEMFRLLAENVVDYAIFVVDPHRHILSWSHGAERLLGFTEAEILGHQCDCFFTPEDVAAGVPQRELDEALRTGRGDDDRWHIRKDGTRFWASGAVTPLKDEGGRLRGFAKIMRDRTDLKRAQDELSASRKRLQALFDNTLDAVLLADDRGRYVDANPAACTLLGYGRDELLRLTVFDVTPPPDADAGRAVWAAFLRDGRQEGEYAVRRKDGTTAVVEFRAVANVQPGLHLSVLRDATERTRAEAVLRQSDALLHRVLGSNAIGLIVADFRGNVVQANDAFLGMVGYDRADLDAGRVNFAAMTPPEYRPLDERAMDEMRRSGGHAPFEKEYVRKDGTRVPVLVGTAYLGGEAGDDRGVGFIVDLTEQRKAQGALRESEQRLRAIFDQTVAGVAQTDLAGRFVLVNRRYCEIVGRPADELYALRMQDITHPDDLPGNAQLFGRMVAGGPAFAIEKRYVRPDGSVVWVANSVSLVRGEDGSPVYTVAVSLDVTERRRAEQALRASEARLAEAQRIAGVGSWEVDRPTRRVWWSAETYRLFGLEPGAFEPTVEGFLALVPAEDRAAIRRAMDDALAGAAEYRVDHRVVRADGAVRWVSEQAEVEFGPAGEPVRVVGTVLDITDRVRAGEALRESEGRLRTLSDNLPDGAIYQVVTGPDGGRRFLYVSAGVERLFGVTAAEAAADAAALYGRIHEDDRPRVAAAEEAALRDMAPFDCEFRSRTRTGGLKWLHGRSAPRRLSAGEVVWEGVLVDVTARREAEGRLRMALAAARMVAWEFDPATNRLAVLENAAEVFGLRPGTRIEDGEQAFALLHPDDRERHRATVAGAVAACGSYRTQFRMVRPDTGAVMGMEEWGHAVGGGPGRTERLVGVVMDVTARTAAEQAQRDTEARLRAVLENLPVGVIVAEAPSGRLVLANRQVAEIWRHPFREAGGVGGYGEYHGFHPDGRALEPHEWPLARSVTAGERVAGEEIAFERGDGTRGVMWVSSAPIRDAAGGITAAVVIFSDVTEQRRAEERFRAFLDHSPGALFVKDPAGRYTLASRGFEAALGRPAADILGKTDADLFPPDPARLFGEEDRRVRAEGRPRTFEETFEFGGRRSTFLSVKFPLPDGSVGCVTADITDRKAAEEALVEADRRKDEFLATLAHELRNPLAPLRNGLQVLRLARGDAAAVDRAMGMMDRQLGQMVHLIDDLLDVSRITRGKLHLRRERVDLAGVVQNAVEASRPLIEASAHRLTVALPPDPVVLDADPTRLAQVLANLLTNAAKYTERGGNIRLAARREGGDVVVSVTDTGIGIASEHLPRLFEMFSQVDSALERSQGGLGIGLALVKGLVEMHGGTVEARSGGRGKGSEFVVRLPAAGDTTTPTDAPAVGVAADRSRRRVLVADDNRDAADSLAMMLQLAGHEVHAAHDGQEAVEAAGWFRPDAILLDIGMPRLNGYEAARRIRGEPWGRAVVLVALTGWGQDEDKRRAAEAGFDHHLTKPVDPAALDGLLATLPARPA